MKSYTIQDINSILNGELVGNTTNIIDGVDQLTNAKQNQITFIGSVKFNRYWKTSKACRVFKKNK